MENGVRRWLVNISNWNPSEDQFSFVLAFLPFHEHSAVTRYFKFEDRKRALVSRLLQYSLVHEVLGIPFDKIVIKRTVEGKPYLENGKSLIYPNFNFNSSHHGDYVGIASEPICLVGLDIICNTIHKKESALEFIKNFSSYFTASEWKDIYGAGSSDEILTMFYRRREYGGIDCGMRDKERRLGLFGELSEGDLGLGKKLWFSLPSTERMRSRLNIVLNIGISIGI